MTEIAESKIITTSPSTTTLYLSKWDEIGFGIFLEKPNLRKPFSAKVKALEIREEPKRGTPSLSKREDLSKIENFMFGWALTSKEVLFAPFEAAPTATEQHKDWLESRTAASQQIENGWKKQNEERAKRAPSRRRKRTASLDS